MPRLLELFSGTGSVGRVFEAAGWEVISVDLEPHFEPTICCDARDIELDHWPPGHFDWVHASPPCGQFSMARSTAKTPRDLKTADELALHALNLIRILRPRYFTIENPATGLLKTRSYMQGIPFRDFSYCMYSDWGYRKNTIFWI